MHYQNTFLLSFFHRYFILSSDEIIPPPPPARKTTPPQAVAAAPATLPNPSLAHNLYKTLRSSFKPFPSSKKLSHARSTPDLSSIIKYNKKDDEEDTSSSLENLSNTYASIDLSEKRPTGSILKRRPKPPAIPSKVQEEPIYVSSVSVPFQQTANRSVQSIIRDQNTNVPER
jgi:hypothetical protein